MKTAIITGINGQDGSYLGEYLLDKGYTVVGIRRRSSTDNSERIKSFLHNKNFKLVEGDITDPHNVNSWLVDYKPEEFYNLAAQSHVGTSFKQPILTWRVDAEAVINILEGVKIYSPHTKFYQASTSEMFGSNYSERELTIAEKTGIQGLDSIPSYEKYQDEYTPLSPNSPYAIAKVAAHNAVSLYRRAYEIHASAGILFNHESERRGDQFVTRKITKWIGEYFNWRGEQNAWEKISPFFSKDNINIGDNSFPKLRLGNLDAYRDWGHAQDYVKAMWMMLQQDSPNDYVIATGQTYSVHEFLVEAFKCIGIDEYKNYIVQDPKFMRPSEVQYLKGDATKANTQLGWKPEIDFKELVHRMVDHDKKPKTN